MGYDLWRRHPESNWGIKVLQTSALPLGYAAKKKWSGKRDSNSRPPPWQGGALPLSYFRKWCLRAESNCRHTDFQSVALPTELPRQVVATPIGFEPTIFAVTGRHVNRYTTGPIDYFVSIPYFIFLVNHFL